MALNTGKKSSELRKTWKKAVVTKFEIVGFLGET
jgi:hypothetical protein